MKYIKTFENFNYQVNEEFFGIGKKIDTVKKVVEEEVSKMSDEEKAEAMEYLSEKSGVSWQKLVEGAKAFFNKFNLDNSTEASETIEEVVPEVGANTDNTPKTGEETLLGDSVQWSVNEGIGEKIKDRLIRFVANPLLTGLIGWIGSIVWRASALGWADQPEWIIRIHEQLGAWGGPLSFLLWVIAFVFGILTIAKMFIGRDLGFRDKLY